MSDFTEYDEIARLIAMEVSGELTDIEKEKLTFWINERPENLMLYTRLCNSRSYKAKIAEYRKVNMESVWERFSPRLAEKRKVIGFKRTFFYAASVIILFSVIGSAYYYNQMIQHVPQEQEFLAQSGVILPGSSKAVLILDDGKSVVLDSTENLSITEKDGTMIQKKGGEIDYRSRTEDQNDTPIYNTLNIPRGGEYHLVLADGTQVYLNAMSSFKFPVKFTGNTREVELTGEAYFEVTKDARRPFIVRTGAMNLQVLGTSFNLNAYENTDKIVTTLVEGKVMINSVKNKETRILMPDEQATFDLKDGRTEIKKVDVTLFTDWKDGNLIFYNNRLEDIMTTLSRWYAIDVVYADASVKNLRFCGNLNRHGEMDQILDILKTTGQVKIEINQNQILFRKNRVR